MQKVFLFLMVGFITVLLAVGSAAANTIDLSGWTDLTIWDNMGGGGNNGYNGSVDPRTAVDPRQGINPVDVKEDKETEQGTIGHQDWDLEGVFYDKDNGKLALVGGFDFKNGKLHNSHTYHSGDIFFATSTTFENPALAPFGTAEGYDYVMDLDFTTMQYDTFFIGLPGVTTSNVSDIPGSNPWKYVSGGIDALGAPGPLDTLYYYDGVTGVSFDGTTRYAITVDLASLGIALDDGFFYTHFTFECGNDNLMGYQASTPEPATMLLLGTGLIGLAGIGRKKKNKMK